MRFYSLNDMSHLLDRKRMKSWASLNSGLYDDQGNIKREMSDAERAAREVWSAVAIVPAAPFAMAELLPPEVWKAISILLEAAK